ncbi:hypothetical protein ACFQVA_05755 [Actinomadura keratinilytica]
MPYELTGAALRALAEGRTDPDPLADPAVTGAVREVLAAEPEVVRAHLARSTGATDGVLAVVLAPGADPAATLNRVARALAAAEPLRARLVRGLDLAVLPATTDGRPRSPSTSAEGARGGPLPRRQAARGNRGDNRRRNRNEPSRTGSNREVCPCLRARS